MLDFNDSAVRLVDDEMIEGLRGVRDDADGACGNRFVDIAIAVGGAAFHRDENGAGMDAARVVLDAGDRLRRTSRRSRRR